MKKISARILLIVMSLLSLVPGDVSAAETSSKLKVKVIKINRNSDTIKIAGMGSITCPKSLEIGFDDNGCISEMLVDQGDRVQEGQLLARLDDSVLKAEKEAMEAKLMAAQAEVKYYKNELTKKESLFSKSAVSDTEFQKAMFELEKADAAVAVAKAEIRTIEAKIAKKVLLAPVFGIVAQRHADVGAVIMPGSNKVLRLIQCNEVFAEIELGERLYPAACRAKEAEIQVSAIPGRIFRGKIDRIGPEIDKKTRTFKLRIKIPNSDLVLRPGMFTDAQVFVPDENVSLSLPSSSIIGGNQSGQATVYVVKDGVAVRRNVVVSSIKDSVVEIANGLELGDLVVVEGTDRVSDLAEVIVESVKEN